MGGTKGASIHVRGVATALRRRGHDVRILAARAEEPVDPSLPPVVPFGYDRMLKSLRREIQEQRGGRTVASEVHGLALNLAAMEELTALDQRWPVEGVYERFSLWSLAGLRFARSRRVPWILEVNAPLVQEQRRYRDLSLEPAAAGIEALALEEADAVVVPSEELRTHVLDVARGRKFVRVIPNGVDTDLFGAPERGSGAVDRVPKRRFVVAFCGSLKPWHGVEILLDAFERLLRKAPEAHLLVIGEGPMLPEVIEARRSLGANAVTATGAVAHEEVAGWLAAAHVGVAPYPLLPRFYFSPLKVLEYMASGLPVVATSIGQIPSLVPDGKCGLLLPSGRAGALAEALLKLRNDGRLRAVMGRRAARRARGRFSWDRVAARIEALFEARLRRHAARTDSRDGTPRLAGAS